MGSSITLLWNPKRVSLAATHLVSLERCAVSLPRWRWLALFISTAKCGAPAVPVIRNGTMIVEFRCRHRGLITFSIKDFNPPVVSDSLPCVCSKPVKWIVFPTRPKLPSAEILEPALTIEIRESAAVPALAATCPEKIDR